METIVLNFIGKDSWGRPVYKDETGQMFKDLNLGETPIHLCTTYGDIEAEPDTSISNIEHYKNVHFEIKGMESEPSSEDRFNYMMLSRLKMDCNYFLGFGNGHVKHLYYDTIDEHISEMKKLYNSFSDDKKPEWLTLDEIIEYENEMKLYIRKL